MPPAARIADMHTCPMSTGPVPHVGGPVMLGCPTVLIGGMPAARVGDMVTCCGPPDTIAIGSPTVFIGGMPAARMGDMCAHGGTIVMGFPQVLIGEMGGAPTIPSIPSLPSLTGLSIRLPEIHIPVPSIALELPHLTLPRLKKLHLPSLVASFGKGLFEGVMNKQNLEMFVARSALVALGANPELVGAAMALYGAYSLYQTCDQMGDGNALAGMAKLGSALASGNANDYAHLAGNLASIAVMGKANDAVDDAALTGTRNANAISKVDDALNDASKAGKAGKAAKASSAAGKIAKAGDKIDRASAAAGQAQENADENHSGILGLV
ncbi:PAAR domain-containing protein [Bremerella sp. JC770]|uniref:PAAR domain-containing protein n=1 Tax=Bremerella sp. JC770 TaxID=3232137 RepID=UPI003458C741